MKLTSGKTGFQVKVYIPGARGGVKKLLANKKFEDENEAVSFQTDMEMKYPAAVAEFKNLAYFR